MDMTESLVLKNIPAGSVVDLSGYYIRAVAPMDCLVKICSDNTRTLSSFNGFCTIKLGWVNANGMAQTGVEISETWDSRIEMPAVTSALGTGVWLNGGNSNVANSKIDIGAITGCGGNGLLLQTLTNDITWNVQGNHITVGQVIDNGGSGIVAWTGAFANIIVAGPVEHNAVFAACDNSGGVAPFANIWVGTGTNSNGMAGGPL